MGGILLCARSGDNTFPHVYCVRAILAASLSVTVNISPFLCCQWKHTRPHLVNAKSWASKIVNVWPNDTTFFKTRTANSDSNVFAVFCDILKPHHDVWWGCTNMVLILFKIFSIIALIMFFIQARADEAGCYDDSYG